VQLEDMPDLIDKVFQPIIGKPCWQVQQGIGSFLTFEFGEPRLHIREPRQASEQASESVKRNAARRSIYVHGDWHLWVYICSWRIYLHDQELANDHLNRRAIKKAINELDGQAPTKVTISQDLRTTFEFDLGGRLETFPNIEDFDRDVDLWLLYEPSGDVFTLRADGYYHHAPGNTLPQDYDWKPLIL
jgi:hypothetical protein